MAEQLTKIQILVDAGSSVSDIYGIKFSLMSDFLFIYLSDIIDECVYSVIFNDAYRTSAGIRLR